MRPREISDWRPPRVTMIAKIPLYYCYTKCGWSISYVTMVPASSKVAFQPHRKQQEKMYALQT